MNILVVSQFYYPENFSITPLCEGLVARGHQVTVVTGMPTYGFESVPNDYRTITQQTIAGVNVLRVNAAPRGKTSWSIINNYWSFYQASKKRIQELKPTFDVVFSMSLSPVISVSAGIDYAKKYGKKHLFYCVDLWPEALVAAKHLKPNSLLYRFIDNWSKRIYQAMDHILVGTPSYRDYLIQHHRVPSNQISTLIQPSILETPPKEKISFGRGVHFVYAGNLGPLQRLDLWLEAFKRTDNKTLHLHVIGQGVQKETLQRWVIDHHLSDRIRFYGTLESDKTASYFKDADALIVSLVAPGVIGQTIPSKLVHYMAHGKLILATLSGDGRSLLLQSGGGYLADPNVESIARLYDKVASLSAIEKKELGQKNSTFYQENLSLSKALDTLETYLIKLKS